MNKRIFRIGTRGSPLSLIQTREVMRAFGMHHPTLEGRLEVVPMKTTGDTIVDRCLIELGGKSLFTKEIESALLKGHIDLAVHSMKDMAAEFPEGLIVPAMLEREDPRDALVTHQGQLLEDLPKDALFGTSSLRRQALVLQKFPHLKTVPLRGSVQTRLSKIENGDIDATLLAVAGLKRMGLLEKATQILSLEEYLPAVAQGAIGIQCREEDPDILELLVPLNHQPTFQAVSAERAFMKALNGSCRTPIAAYGMIEGETLFLKGMLSEPQGMNMRFVSHQGFASQAKNVGREAAQYLQEKPCPVSS
jgi:hydroxymethylbilane synthase